MTTSLKARYGHSLTASSLGPGLTVVTVFGGSGELFAGSSDKQPKLADTTLLQFSECTSDIHVHVHVYLLTLSQTRPLWNAKCDKNRRPRKG